MIMPPDVLGRLFITLRTNSVLSEKQAVRGLVRGRASMGCGLSGHTSKDRSMGFWAVLSVLCFFRDLLKEAAF